MKPMFALPLWMLAAACLTGVVTSKLLWGYWLSPPAVAPELGAVSRLSAMVELKPAGAAPQLGWSQKPLAADEIRSGAAWYEESSIDHPAYRLHAAIVENALVPSAGEPLAPWVLEGVQGYVSTYPELVEGESGYTCAKELRGYAAAGAAGDGQLRVVLALMGREVANDHYPVYDFAFLCHEGEQRCRATRQSLYFEDVAGIEGLRWWVVAGILFVPAAILGLLAALLAALARLARRLVVGVRS